MVVAPLLEMGDVLIFDYRVRHRGLGNRGDRARPVAYMTYTKDSNTTDSFNFPKMSVFDAFAQEPAGLLRAEEVLQKSILKQQCVVGGFSIPKDDVAGTASYLQEAKSADNHDGSLGKANNTNTNDYELTPYIVDDTISSEEEGEQSCRGSEVSEVENNFHTETVQETTTEHKRNGEQSHVQDYNKGYPEDVPDGDEVGNSATSTASSFWKQLRFDNKSREILGVEDTNEYFIAPENIYREEVEIQDADIYREVRGYGFASLPGGQVRKLLNPELVAVNWNEMRRLGVVRDEEVSTCANRRVVESEIHASQFCVHELCGNRTAANVEPVAHNYSGFQYGSFAGQLGDGTTTSAHAGEGYLY